MMRRFADEMERAFEGFGFPDLRRLSPWRGIGEFSPEVDIVERDGKLLVRADLPGVELSDIRVEVAEDNLVIEGERRQEREEEEQGFRIVERSYGHFRREIPLPEGANPDTAKASFKNGVLEVTLDAPHIPENRRQIEVQGEKSEPQSGGEEAA
jgi:HSP20 family protein